MRILWRQISGIYNCNLQAQLKRGLEKLSSPIRNKQPNCSLEEGSASNTVKGRKTLPRTREAECPDAVCVRVLSPLQSSPKALRGSEDTSNTFERDLRLQAFKGDLLPRPREEYEKVPEGLRGYLSRCFARLNACAEYHCLTQSGYMGAISAWLLKSVANLPSRIKPFSAPVFAYFLGSLAVVLGKSVRHPIKRVHRWAFYLTRLYETEYQL